MEQKIQTIKSWLGTGSINIFGDPFAGKDTQSEVLSKLFDAPIVGGGEIMRSLPPDAPEQKEMATGILVTSELFLRIMIPYLQHEEYDGKPLILSSVGRKEGEENGIVQACEAGGHPIKAVLLLSLTEDEVWKRFAAAQTIDDRGDRADDSSEALRVRLEKYRTETTPVINFYREHGLLIEVDGIKSVEEVTNELIDALYAKASA